MSKLDQIFKKLKLKLLILIIGNYNSINQKVLTIYNSDRSWHPPEPISAVLIAPTDNVWPGANVTITASVTAYPAPQLKWFLNGNLLSSEVILIDIWLVQAKINLFQIMLCYSIFNISCRYDIHLLI